jgi:hypothetical protein
MQNSDLLRWTNDFMRKKIANQAILLSSITPPILMDESGTGLLYTSKYRNKDEIKATASVYKRQMQTNCATLFRSVESKQERMSLKKIFFS